MQHGLRLYSFDQQIQAARPVFDHGRGLRADRPNAGADVWHGASNEWDSGGNPSAGLSSRRVDGTKRERGILRQPIIVEKDAV